MAMAKQQYNLSLLISSAIRTIRSTQRYIRQRVERDPVEAFAPERIGDRQKAAISIDREAQLRASDSFRETLGRYDLLILGEESSQAPQELNLRRHDGLVILLDMIDGTDLLERGLSNWCSALVLYTRKEGILASFVGIPEDGVYFATYADKHAFKYRNVGKPIAIHRPTGATCEPNWRSLSFDVDTLDLAGPRTRLLSVRVPQVPADTPKRLEEATVCMNTQKLGNIEALARVGPLLYDWIEKRKETADKLRFYNLSGNPMLARLAEGRVDAVLNLKASAPHDFIPGAFIAQRAGASILAVEKKMTESIVLAKALREPKTQYIAARSMGLAKEIAALMPDTSPLGPESD